MDCERLAHYLRFDMELSYLQGLYAEEAHKRRWGSIDSSAAQPLATHATSKFSVATSGAWCAVRASDLEVQCDGEAGH